MRALMRRACNYVYNQQGQTILEYGFILSLVSVLAAVIISLIGTQALDLLTSVHK